MKSLESLYLPLFVPVPDRDPHILIYKTSAFFAVELNISRSGKRAVKIEGKICREALRQLRNAMNVIVKEALPDSFLLRVYVETEHSCFIPSMLVSSLLKLIDLTSQYYEESFSDEDKDEIVEGILSERLGFFRNLGKSLSIATRKKISLLFSASELREISTPPIDVYPKKRLRIGNAPVLEQRMADLIAKMNSLFLFDHYESILEENEEKRNLSERGINSLFHYMYGVPTMRQGVYSFDTPSALCFYRIGGGRKK
ncbi:MAG: hypothetical protein QW039_05545 [Fervidicoccaceae archaeon]